MCIYCDFQGPIWELYIDIYVGVYLDNISEQYFAFFQAVVPAGHENYKTMSNISVAAIVLYVLLYTFTARMKDDLKLNLA